MTLLIFFIIIFFFVFFSCRCGEANRGVGEAALERYTEWVGAPVPAEFIVTGDDGAPLENAGATSR